MAEAGRARGVARGRGRGVAAGGGQARRPGEAPTPANQQAAPPQAGVQAWGAPVPSSAPPRAGAPSSAVAAGRAAHRTVAQSPPEHAGDVNIQQRMQDVEIAVGAADGDAGGRGSRRGGGRILPETILRTRPPNVNSKKGTFGTPLKLSSNYFALLTQPNWCLYQYHVNISPDEDRTQVRRSLMRAHKELLGGYVFDGMMLYTAKRLPQDTMEVFSVRREDDEKMRLQIKLVGDLSPGDYHYIQVFNIIMRKCIAGLQLQLIGRDFFDPVARVEVRDYKLQIWPGYKTTINQHENNILMVAELAHKVMRLDTILDMLREYSQTGGASFKKRFQEDVVGKIVLTDYNNRTYRIDDVDWNSNPEATFTMRGETISYIEYYKRKYQIQIRDMKQPLLISRAKPRELRAGMAELIYLVPELCRQTGLSDEMRTNFQLMKSLANHTKLGPDLRIQKLLAFNKRLQSTPVCVQELTDWNMKLDSKLIEFTGRLLPPEVICMNADGRTKFPAGETFDGWTRDMRSKTMLSVGQVTSWAVITPAKLAQTAQSFAKMIADTGRGVGMSLQRPEFIEMRDDRSGTYSDTLEKLIARSNPTFIVCILFRNAPDRYEAIKKKCCIDRPVPTQVICSRNMTSKNAMSIATKIAIQINCKVGGAPWTVEVPLKGLMAIGYDVCHDTGSKERSFGAMVATLDGGLTQFFNAVNSHTNGEELSSQFSFNIGRALEVYLARNGALPSRIIIYRDGVGDGQIPTVYKHEVEMIKTKLLQYYPEHTYKMAFIIVSKRINSRIFLSDNRSNPKPGTIIDDHITLPERYDFLLVSQSVREGTVAPTSYNIIHDTVSLSADQLQRLTFKMCHLYYNCSNPVRVPAVCQYAHKLAFLAGQSLHRQPHNALETSLYFL